MRLPICAAEAELVAADPGLQRQLADLLVWAAQRARKVAPASEDSAATFNNAMQGLLSAPMTMAALPLLQPGDASGLLLQLFEAAAQWQQGSAQQQTEHSLMLHLTAGQACCDICRLLLERSDETAATQAAGLCSHLLAALPALLRLWNDCVEVPSLRDLIQGHFTLNLGLTVSCIFLYGQCGRPVTQAVTM